MANTLTNLIPNVYSALDVVSRELVGFIPAVQRNATAERAAVGQTVFNFVAPAVTATNITPGVIPPDDGDQTIGSTSLTITKARRVPIRWNGEDTRGLNNNGAGQNKILQGQIQQALRTLTNEMEADIAAMHKYASRAYGTVGTTPFGTNTAESAQMKKLLDDNGAPPSSRSLIIDTTTGAAIRTLPQFNRVNEAGTDMTLRDGELLNLAGFSVKESAQIATFTAGAMASATTNTAGYAVGATQITLATAGTGVIAQGDVITFAGDANKYVVASTTFAGSNPAAGDKITLAAPGLRKAISASATAISVIGTSNRLLAFSQNAIVLATRQPALPDGGDLAIDRTAVTDSRSRITFEIAMYPQYRQMQYEISACWGVAVTKAEHLATLIY